MMKPKEDNAIHASPQTFSDLIRGLQYSVNTAQQVLENHHLYLLSRFTDKDGNITTKKITLPNGNTIDIPILSFMNMGALMIDELELDFNTKIDQSTMKHYDHEEYTRSSFDVDVAVSSRESNGLMHVKMKFKNRELPEAVSRLNDELNKFMNPKEASI